MQKLKSKKILLQFLHLATLTNAVLFALVMRPLQI